MIHVDTNICDRTFSLKILISCCLINKEICNELGKQRSLQYSLFQLSLEGDILACTLIYIIRKFIKISSNL